MAMILDRLFRRKTEIPTNGNGLDHFVQDLNARYDEAMKLRIQQRRVAQNETLIPQDELPIGLKVMIDSLRFRKYLIEKIQSKTNLPYYAKALEIIEQYPLQKYQPR